MRTVRNVLDEKGDGVHHIHPDASVFDALTIMAEHNIGALVVLNGGNLVGIVTERDYARKIILKGRTSPALWSARSCRRESSARDLIRRSRNAWPS